MCIAVDMTIGLALRVANARALMPRQLAIRFGPPLHVRDAMLFGHQRPVFAAGQLARTARPVNAIVLPVLAGIDISPRVPIMPKTGHRGSDQHTGSDEEHSEFHGYLRR